MRAQHVPEPFVPALTREMEIDLTEPGHEASRILLMPVFGPSGPTAIT